MTAFDKGIFKRDGAYIIDYYNPNKNNPDVIWYDGVNGFYTRKYLLSNGANISMSQNYNGPGRHVIYLIVDEQYLEKEKVIGMEAICDRMNNWSKKDIVELKLEAKKVRLNKEIEQLEGKKKDLERTCEVIREKFEELNSIMKNRQSSKKM